MTRPKNLVRMPRSNEVNSEVGVKICRQFGSGFKGMNFERYERPLWVDQIGYFGTVYERLSKEFRI